jgi:hypothetical protein
VLFNFDQFRSRKDGSDLGEGSHKLFIDPTAQLAKLGLDAAQLGQNRGRAEVAAVEQGLQADEDGGGGGHSAGREGHESETAQNREAGGRGVGWAADRTREAVKPGFR